jgi:hypothetical protein
MIERNTIQLTYSTIQPFFYTTAVFIKAFSETVIKISRLMTTVRIYVKRNQDCSTTMQMVLEVPRTHHGQSPTFHTTQKIRNTTFSVHFSQHHDKAPTDIYLRIRVVIFNQSPHLSCFYTAGNNDDYYKDTMPSCIVMPVHERCRKIQARNRRKEFATGK